MDVPTLPGVRFRVLGCGWVRVRVTTKGGVGGYVPKKPKMAAGGFTRAKHHG